MTLRLWRIRHGFGALAEISKADPSKRKAQHDEQTANNLEGIQSAEPSGFADSLPVIGKLKRRLQIRPFEQRHDRLQIVFAFTGYAHLLILDLSVRF